MTSQHRQDYHKQGYVILHQALSTKRINDLTNIVQTLISHAREGKVKMKWAGPNKEMPDGRVISLLNPHSKWKVYDPYYVTWLNEDILPIVEFLQEGKSRCTLLSILFHGKGRTRVREGWHRDGGAILPEKSSPMSTTAVLFKPR